MFSIEFFGFIAVVIVAAAILFNIFLKNKKNKSNGISGIPAQFSASSPEGRQEISKLRAAKLAEREKQNSEK